MEPVQPPLDPDPVTSPPEFQGATAKEPVLIFLGALAAIVDAGIAVAAGLDWVSLTNEQTAAIIAFVTLLTGVIAAMLRASVYAPATVAAERR